ncbi:tRNA synthetases class I (C) catalytic domain-containing protein [Gautieria morchelliformis]|nr:tRNA synthetases class I (C) catalytic domain-containing protein [Gautieria morchelliformis]
MSKQQPEWRPPTNAVEEPVLRVYNSLTRTKNGRHVKWYNCGPTVYDASHMGHARNYVTQDIIRRIFVDYFGYNVHFVMNITDVDDKIIERARRTYLIQELLSRTTSLTPVLLDQVRSSWVSYYRSQLSKGLPNEKNPADGQEERTWEGILALADSDDAWKSACIARDEKFESHKLIASRDILALSLDAQACSSPNLSSYGNSITDPSIPRLHASYWEAEFMKDMKRLHVLPPDTLTRVSDYVPEIVDFVKKLVERGYAYELKGSVYFDTRAFDNARGHSSTGEEAEWRHVYLKLEPWSKGNRALLQEGEGALSQSSSRYEADFALWKASKAGEPSWPSVWGPGRPGDLAFPHHDNEIAQRGQAYHDCRQWGLKMSKSLKNFITIDEILRKYTARQLRLAFLLVLWNAKVDFHDSTMKGEVRTLETTFDNFFAIVKALGAQAAADHKYRSVYKGPERDLADALTHAQATFRVALCDSFNTPQALDVLSKLVSRANVYITQASGKANVGVLESIAQWVGKMLRMFGLGEGPQVEGMLGWGESRPEGETTSVDREEILMPYLRTFSSFRDNIRGLAMTQAPPNQVLEFCDKFRDTDMVPLGVALDDQEDGRALVKLVPAATLMRLRDEKNAAAEAKMAKKAAATEAEREKRRAKLEKGKAPPELMFKPPYSEQGVYGSWDDKGIPLTDGEGAEVTKSQRKKLINKQETQQKLHTKWKAWRQEEGDN